MWLFAAFKILEAYTWFVVTGQVHSHSFLWLELLDWQTETFRVCCPFSERIVSHTCFWFGLRPQAEVLCQTFGVRCSDHVIVRKIHSLSLATYETRHAIPMSCVKVAHIVLRSILCPQWTNCILRTELHTQPAVNSHHLLCRFPTTLLHPPQTNKKTSSTQVDTCTYAISNGQTNPTFKHGI